MTYALETRAEATKVRKMLETNEMEVLRKVFGKSKIDRIGSQQFRESCDTQSVNQWVERRKRLVKISKDNIPAEDDLQVSENIMERRNPWLKRAETSVTTTRRKSSLVS